MPIHPLPQFEADVKAMLDERDRLAYEALKAPKTLVVRFGAMKMVGEFAYSLAVTPGCGSRLVVRTHRGVELGEMLTSTCPNSGCGKSVSRKEMLGYIQNSGGRDYPFFQEGKVLRVATIEDMNRQAELEQSRHGLKMEGRSVAERMRSPVRIVDAEPILGGEVLTFFFLSEERVDVRELHHALGNHFRCRVDLKQVGARDDARLTADYERCGQYCCCKNFLKVLKPVSMRSAKVQKATLDPLKISGRCGRLMCCLRYEDETYEDLRKKLPRKKSRVGTPEGDGVVIDSQILTQLVLVVLDDVGADGKERQVAIAVEDLTPPSSAAAPARPAPLTRSPETRSPETRSESPGQAGRASMPPRPGNRGRSNRVPGVREPSDGKTGPVAGPSSTSASGSGISISGPADSGSGPGGSSPGQPRPVRSARGPRGGPPRLPQTPKATPGSGQPPTGDGSGGTGGGLASRNPGDRPAEPRRERPESGLRGGGAGPKGEDSIDDIWNEMETDSGDGQSPGKGQSQGGGGSKRRRRRRGGRGGGGGGGGGVG